MNTGIPRFDKKRLNVGPRNKHTTAINLSWLLYPISMLGTDPDAASCNVRVASTLDNPFTSNFWRLVFSTTEGFPTLGHYLTWWEVGPTACPDCFENAPKRRSCTMEIDNSADQRIWKKSINVLRRIALWFLRMWSMSASDRGFT